MCFHTKPCLSKSFSGINPFNVLSFTSEDTFHMCENSFCPSILWLRMNAGGACKNICTFAQLRTFDEYQFPNSIKMEPNLDFSSILHFSAAIYHHFHFEETMFPQKRVFHSVRNQLDSGCWVGGIPNIYQGVFSFSSI